MQPFGYHLTNLALHAINAAILYFVAFRILRLALSGPPERGQVSLAISAAVATLLFAIHPLRVESVAWATERRDVLSGLFYLLALLAYLRAVERESRGRAWYWGAVGLFAWRLLSKSIAVSLPVVLLILDVYPLRRLGGSIGWWGPAAQRVYLEKVPFGLMAVVASALAFLANAQLHNTASVEQLSVLGRLGVAAYGLSFYLWKTLVPLNLSPLYEMPAKPDPWALRFIQSFGLVLAVTAVVVGLRRRSPALPAAWLAYVVILLPVLGIFHNGPQIAADRYTYLAGIGGAILVGAAQLSWWRAGRFIVAGSAVCVLVGLGVLTWHQTQVWHDSEKLWTHALATYPQSSLAENYMGVSLAERGKLAEAIEHYQRALQIRPDYDGVYYNLGNALAQQGKLAGASEHFRHALRLKPDHAEAHNNLGNALADQGKPAEAIEHYRQALFIQPDSADAHNNLGLALSLQGKPTEAVEHYRQALQIKPYYAVAHYNWGSALIQQGKPAEAVEHYQQALHITPDSADTHSNWGLALAQQGKLAEAVEH